MHDFFSAYTCICLLRNDRDSHGGYVLGKSTAVRRYVDGGHDPFRLGAKSRFWRQSLGGLPQVADCLAGLLRLCFGLCAPVVAVGVFDDVAGAL